MFPQRIGRGLQYAIWPFTTGDEIADKFKDVVVKPGSVRVAQGEAVTFDATVAPNGDESKRVVEKATLVTQYGSGQRVTKPPTRTGDRTFTGEMANLRDGLKYYV